MAVDRDILIACAPLKDSTSKTITTENVDSAYLPASFEPARNDKGDWSLPIDTTKLRWESYIKAAYHVRRLEIRLSLAMTWFTWM